MLNTIKETSTKDLFFTSDTHFFHNKDFIYLAEGYSSSSIRDEALIDKWNSVCDKNSIVYHLGDFAIGARIEEACLNVFRRLNFKKLYLLWGNHNAGVKQIYQSLLINSGIPQGIEAYPMTLNLGDKEIIFLGYQVSLSVHGQLVVLNHFSQRSWLKNGNGSWMLCGHSHGNDSGINPQCKSGKILDVGVANFKHPVSYSDVNQIMRYKNIALTDHH